MNKALLFILILIIIIISFIVFGKQFDLTRGLHNKMFGVNFELVKWTNQYSQPKIQEVKNIEGEWCKPQEIMVNNDVEKPARDRIIGWDISGCCIREVSGYDCALKKNVILKYCYTSNIGSDIFYTTINDYYLANAYEYKTILNNIDKYEIPNKVCDTAVYPYQVKR